MGHGKAFFTNLKIQLHWYVLHSKLQNGPAFEVKRFLLALARLIMHFYVRKRRTTPAVIIVALIDVLIVLVIFLLVTTTFKQQNALKVQLPESSQGKQSGTNENPPLIATINSNSVYFLAEIPVTFGQLEDRLKSAAAKNPKLILEINADENAHWGKVVKVRDAAAAAGIRSLVILTKQPQKP